MELNLTKPLIVFDLETTGLDLVNDRIIQLSYIKVIPGGAEKNGNLLINPGKPIPKEVETLTAEEVAELFGKSSGEIDAGAQSVEVWG